MSRLSLWTACVMGGACGAFQTGAQELIASLPWTTFLSAGTRAQNYPSAQDSLDIWAVEDFRTDRAWLIDSFSCSGSGTTGGTPASATRDVFVVLLDGLPPGGRVVMSSVPGTGRCVAGAARNGWDSFTSTFAGEVLPAGNYYVMWQADLPPANAPAVMFSQDGPYAVGDPDTSYRYWPNQAGRLELIRRNLDGTGPGIGTNFTIRGRAAPCPADFNADGTTDFLDYADFVTCFEGSDCPAGRTSDFNADGTTDFFDYSDFVAAFEAGC